MPRKQWRAGFSRHGALAPPKARPSKLCRLSGQPGLNGVAFNVPTDAVVFTGVTYDATEVFLLPEFFSAPSQYAVGRTGRRSFYQAHKVCNWCRGRTKQMDVARHDYGGIDLAKSVGGGSEQLILNQAGDLDLLQIKRTRTSCIKQAVPRDKRLTGSKVLPFERTLRRQAAMQPPRKKYRQSRSIYMRQPAAIASHAILCARAATLLKLVRGAEAPRRLKPALPYAD